MTALLRVLSHSLKAPRAPKRLTVASLAHYKGQLRAYDSARVAAGVDPAQITRENSFLPPGKMTILFGRFTHPTVARLAAAAKARGE